jgi:hypothetical protein
MIDAIIRGLSRQEGQFHDKISARSGSSAVMILD